MTLSSLLVSVAVVAAPVEAPQARDMVAECLAIAAEGSADLSTRFSVMQSTLQPVDAIGPDGPEWTLNREVTWYAWDGLRRVEERVHDLKLNATSASLEVWDGVACYRGVPGEAGGRIELERSAIALEPGMLLFNQAVVLDAPGGAGASGSLIEAVRRGEPLRHEVDDERIRYRYRLDHEPDATVYEVVVRTHPFVALERFAWEMPAAHPERHEYGFHARFEFDVLEWTAVGEHWHPAVAERRLYIFDDVSNERGPLRMGLRRYERGASEPLTIDSADMRWFEPPFRVGGIVLDASLGMAFEWGGHRMWMDHEQFRVARRMFEHPRLNPQALTRIATSNETVSSPADGVARESSAGSPTPRGAATGLWVFVLAFAGATAMRHGCGSSKKPSE